MAVHALTIATASRPRLGETENGDRVQVDWHAEVCRISVIDGLGHGPEAAADAARAADALREHPTLSPAEALKLCDRALRGRRGAAVSIAAIDTRQHTLRFAGIGNVEGRINQAPRSERLITFRGIVGVAMRTVRTFDFELRGAWTLALHTDGVSARFEDEVITRPLQPTLNELAQDILERWGRERDDATVVLAQLVHPST